MAQPRSTERDLARIWTEILGIEVGPHDSFLDFTDSLSALRYVNRVRDTYQVDVTVSDLLEGIPDIATLARIVEQQAASDAAPAPVPAAAAPDPATMPAAEPVPPHAVSLPGGEWQVWRTAAVRGAGFPVSLITRMSAPDVAAAADRYLSSLAAVDRCLQRALEDSEATIPSTDPERRREARAARHRLRRGRVDAEHGSPAQRELAAAIAERQRAWTAYEARFDAASRQSAQTLRELVGGSSFREAAMWQNRAALRLAWRRIHEAAATPKVRHAIDFLAMVLQRYAVKNDSIGFFGPVGWAAIADEPGVCTVKPGARLLETRNVYFEGWAIDALCARLNEDPAVRRWAAPRRKAGVWMTADEVAEPIAGTLALGSAERRVLTACDGVTPAATLAERLPREQPALFAESSVSDVLERLLAKNLIAWELEVAPQLHPERDLAARISCMGDADVRASCQRALQELCDARDAVARAAGDADSVDRALAELETTFARVTGSNPSRRAGEMYAARGLVYEDCRRGGEVRFGREFLARLGPPVSVVLDGARWVSSELRRAFTQHLRECHAQLRASLRSDAVGAHLLLTYVGKGARQALAPMSRDVRERYQERWAAILQASGEERGIARTVEEVSARARLAFATSGPSSWGGYVSPDIMIAAADGQAFQRGGFRAVLGEIHNSNTLIWSALLAQHPDIPAVESALARDLARHAAVVVQVPRARWVSRLNPAVVRSFWRYEYGDDPPAAASCHSLPAALLVTVEDDGLINVRARDGSVEFDAYELFAVTMSYEADRIVSDFLPPAPHRPRITIGDLTISRERWRVSPAAMPLSGPAERAAQFAAIRGWARELGMPQRVFVRSPGETKPCYLDFTSPVYVAVFAKLMRKLSPTAEVSLVEMVPDVDQTWLTDAAGQRYTSELRLVTRTPRAT